MERTTVLPSSDYTDSFNRHVLAAIPRETLCLDVGCWTGNLGRMLMTEKACVVEGVDAVPGVLEEALKAGYKKTYQINLNAEALELSSFDKQYDIIIFADVLEHLIHPAMVLREFSRLLSPGGRVVISLPNVAFLLNRLRLLLGKWDYTDFGTLDKTHLRFYTLRSAQQMVEEAGLKVSTVRPYNQFGILASFDPPLLPSLFAYQFLLVARPDSSQKTKS